MLDLARWDWSRDWPYPAGALVVLASAVLIERARRRAVAERARVAALPEAARQALESDRAATRDRRGRRVEDLLTAAVAAAAAGLSAAQLGKFGRDVMGLSGPWAYLPFVALDFAAVVCALRARRRAARGAAAGLSGALVWVLALLSASMSASEGTNVGEAFALGIWAPIAAVLWELGLAEERHARTARADRRVGWIRWLHPVERVLVLAELASDEHLGAAEATERVRERRAARALYRLRQATEARAARAASARPKRGSDRRYRRAEALAQRTAARVRLADAEVEAAVLPQLRVLVNVSHLANMTWPTPMPMPTGEQGRPHPDTATLAEPGVPRAIPAPAGTPDPTGSAGAANFPPSPDPTGHTAAADSRLSPTGTPETTSPTSPTSPTGPDIPQPTSAPAPEATGILGTAHRGPHPTRLPAPAPAHPAAAIATPAPVPTDAHPHPQPQPPAAAYTHHEPTRAAPHTPTHPPEAAEVAAEVWPSRTNPTHDPTHNPTHSPTHAAPTPPTPPPPAAGTSRRAEPTEPPRTAAAHRAPEPTPPSTPDTDGQPPTGPATSPAGTNGPHNPAVPAPGIIRPRTESDALSPSVGDAHHHATSLVSPDLAQLHHRPPAAAPTGPNAAPVPEAHPEASPPPTPPGNTPALAPTTDPTSRNPVPEQPPVLPDPPADYEIPYQGRVVDGAALTAAARRDHRILSLVALLADETDLTAAEVGRRLGAGERSAERLLHLAHEELAARRAHANNPELTDAGL
ncbi:hypothetical protein [Embleya sp. AB8]|uniref:hypothetical protein n=1 Tax=Embleya sp. AB8 TaxID=3156304 RepID=UPI003C70DEDC